MEAAAKILDQGLFASRVTLRDEGNMVNLAQHVRKGAHRLAHVLEILRARSNDSPLKLCAARVTPKGVNLEQ